LLHHNIESRETFYKSKRTGPTGSTKEQEQQRKGSALQLTFNNCMSENKNIEQLIQQVASLSLQVAELKTLIKSQAQPTTALHNRRTGAHPTFAIGDRVHIINKVKKPSHWTGPWDQKQAQVGTVTAVDQDRNRVHILTNNKTNTWRIHKNVNHLL
jgi:ribosomal protein L21E